MSRAQHEVHITWSIGVSYLREAVAAAVQRLIMLLWLKKGLRRWQRPAKAVAIHGGGCRGVRRVRRD